MQKVKSQYPKARLAFTGDLVDRGPNSFEVVDRVRQLVEEEDAIALLGNHEMFAIRFAQEALAAMRNGDERPLDNVWTTYNGGKQTIESYNRHFNKYGKRAFAEQFVQSKHYKFLAELPFYYEDDDVFLSHAPVPVDKFIPRYQGTDLWRLSEEVLTWSYIDRMDHEADFARDHGKLAVCGHIHRLRENVWWSRDYPHIIYNDSGAGCSPKAILTAAIIKKGVFIEFVESDQIV